MESLRTRLGLLFLIALFSSLNLKAQVTIGSTADPDIDAVLELISNDSQGLLLPRLELVSTDSEAPMSKHTVGMVIYNIGDALPQGYYYNDGAQWVQITDTNIASWRSVATKDAATSNTEDIYQSGAVVVGASALENKTQFAVVSTNKGVLLPRMTTFQRDNNITPIEDIPDGLLIYNLDTHCYNYFNAAAGTGGKWVSLCGDLDPADFSLADCTGIIVPDPAVNNQAYKVGVPLTSAHTYTINV